MKITKNGVGICFVGGQIHLVHDTKLGGVVGPLKFSNFPNFPLSDHGVHTPFEDPSTPRPHAFATP